MKKKKTEFMTIELREDVYFAMLRYCWETRTTIDDFVARAARNAIKLHKSKRGAK
jgi:hypothetical protein